MCNYSLVIYFAWFKFKTSYSKQSTKLKIFDWDSLGRPVRFPNVFFFSCIYHSKDNDHSYCSNCSCITWINFSCAVLTLLQYLNKLFVLIYFFNAIFIPTLLRFKSNKSYKVGMKWANRYLNLNQPRPKTM